MSCHADQLHDPDAAEGEAPDVERRHRWQVRRHLDRCRDTTHAERMAAQELRRPSTVAAFQSAGLTRLVGTAWAAAGMTGADAPKVGPRPMLSTDKTADELRPLIGEDGAW